MNTAEKLIEAAKANDWAPDRVNTEAGKINFLVVRKGERLVEVKLDKAGRFQSAWVRLEDGCWQHLGARETRYYPATPKAVETLIGELTR